MSAKGEHGMNIWLDKVPTRQDGMLAWEILLSESQERMLMVVEKGREEEVEVVFAKWDLHYAIIGEVTPGDRLKYYMNGELQADVPAGDLVLGGGAPVYDREYTEPAYFSHMKDVQVNDVPEPESLADVARFLVSTPNLASKKWVIDQYDSMVGTANMSTNKPSDAGVVHVKGTNKALALTVDCNARYVHANPEVGASIAVCEAARNIVCSGGRPMAITNCLNFGNPYNPEVYWQFVKAIQGMGKACSALGTPVTGGNVSFYNQTVKGKEAVPVFPTPTIGMLGLIDDLSKTMTLAFEQADDLIYLIGESSNDINSSEYLNKWHKVAVSPAPYFDLSEELAVQDACLRLIQEELIQSAHDVSDGGLFCNLMESARVNHLGFAVDTDEAIRRDAFLFGEAQGRIVVSVEPGKQEAFVEFMATSEVPFSLLGKVTQDGVSIDDENWGSLNDFTVGYETAISNLMNEQSN